MTGKAKIEGLTNAWYGFAVFSAAAAILGNGIGVWSLGKAVVGLLFSWVLTFFLGRSLLKKSSLVRSILIIVSALSSVLGMISAGKDALAFVSSWELSLLGAIVYSGAAAWMNIRSFRTLTDPSVKAYFN
jgi:hypothetical protein